MKLKVQLILLYLIVITTTSTELIDDNIQTIAETFQWMVSNVKEETLHVGVFNVKSQESKDLVTKMSSNTSLPIHWIISTTDEFGERYQYPEIRALDLLILFADNSTKVRIWAPFALKYCHEFISPLHRYTSRLST